MLSAVDGGKHPICFSQCPTNLFLFQSTHPSGVRHLQLSHLTYRFEISIHAPQWGATNTRLSALPCLGHFNPRTPVGCDRSSDTPYPRTRYYFNPRTPVGCDRNGWCPRSPQPHFNPRTPVGCDSLLIISLRTGHHFNPRTPVGCDEIIHAVGGFDTISIHAPQWGATDGTATFRSDAVISIHAPQWGATTDNQLISDTMIGISIHAPQWGATDPNSGTVQQVVFQSTHPSGVRPKPSCRRVDCPQFQSTHPSGVRLPHHVRRGARFRISIHAPQWGATSPEGATALVHTISIHAPQWGATPRRPIGGLPREISIHAPQWGATSSGSRRRVRQMNFNPRTPVGCDTSDTLYFCYRDISIHAPQWGATATPSWTPSSRPYFNPRTPVGCDGARGLGKTYGIHFNPRTPVGCDRASPIQ